MRVIVAPCFAIVLTVVAAASADQPKLVGETVLMKSNSKYYGLPGIVRLSPDGERLLLREGGRVVLREWRTGRETAIPGPSLTDSIAASHAVIPNPFSADGKLVLVPAGVDRDGDGVCVAGKEEIQPAVYHIETGKLRRIPVQGFRMFATFDAAGKHLIFTMMGKTQPPTGKTYVAPVGSLKPRVLSSWGLPRAARPGGSTLALMQFIVPPKGGPPALKLVLYDFMKDAKVAGLPLHERTLSGYHGLFPPKWTSDGRYLYYLDMVPAAGEKTLTRVWNVQESKEVLRLPDRVPIGPCGGATTMILSQLPGNDLALTLAVLHDASTHKEQPLSGSTRIHPISTNGKYLIYDRKNERGEHVVCRAKIGTRPK